MIAEVKVEEGVGDRRSFRLFPARQEVSSEEVRVMRIRPQNT